ncbi:lysis protein [Pseudocitrobacter sp. RIT415]|uniref:lysis protein n=1 Tax=Pseudocitrobacter sp. RIT415 TaxID=2202163 RepID=UPI000D390F05|nr:lysis protein [Pseudocitrobacter sp. RIT 415]RAU45267.1 lysis protein [Pseudocitrobacter sp. RIT 415]
MFAWILVAGASITMAADRWALQRATVKNLCVGDHKVEQGHLRVPVYFNVKSSRLVGATIEFTLRDKRCPTTVVAFNRRTLEHASKGENCEYLDIPLDRLILPSGQWIINVKILHGDSFYNPLYRIFPLQLDAQKVFEINLGSAN